MHFILIIIRINDDRWINLNLKNILENSNGKRKYSYRIFPIDKGNKIYCSKKDTREIFPINSIIKKIEIITMDPNNPQTILLILKLKIKYIKDNKIIIKKMYPVGVCFV